MVCSFWLMNELFRSFIISASTLTADESSVAVVGQAPAMKAIWKTGDDFLLAAVSNSMRRSVRAGGEVEACSIFFWERRRTIAGLLFFSPTSSVQRAPRLSESEQYPSTSTTFVKHLYILQITCIKKWLY